MAEHRSGAPSPARSTLTKVLEEAEQIAIGIGYDELPVPSFNIVLPIPTLFYRNDDRQLGATHGSIEQVDCRNLDLKVDASPKRKLQRRGTKATPRTCRFLQHKVRLLARE